VYFQPIATTSIVQTVTVISGQKKENVTKTRCGWPTTVSVPVRDVFPSAGMSLDPLSVSTGQRVENVIKTINGCCRTVLSRVEFVTQVC
jgi:hypothetical protein